MPRSGRGQGVARWLGGFRPPHQHQHYCRALAGRGYAQARRALGPACPPACRRVTNVGSQRAIALEDVQLQYWLNGPDSTLDPWPTATATTATVNGGGAGAQDEAAGGGNATLGPASQPQFKLFCSDVSSGLREWRWCRPPRTRLPGTAQQHLQRHRPASLPCFPCPAGRTA